MANWGNIGSRGNVDDRRGLVPVMGGVSLAGVALVLVVNYFAGGDLGDALSMLQQLPAGTGQSQVVSEEFAGEDEYEVFASTVLGSNNDVWRVKLGKYEEPRLVLFRQATQSGCGAATSQIGPHYCPTDGTIYLDETFFDELTRRFGAEGGDVAEAYVIAHEVGHHVQNLTGDLGRSQESNEASVKTELQADCYAGIWANSLRDRDVFGPGEIGEAMDAAAAVGDDRIQEAVSGSVNPESWTHGSSEERVRWFTVGYESGSVEECDTFGS